MREKYIECYARYILKFLQEYKKHGINISALTPQNEPETQQSGLMPACIWHPDIEAKYILELKKLLDENKMDTRIWMYDHNYSGWQRVAWCFDEYKELADACTDVAYHYYEGSAKMIAKLKEKFPDLKLHFTEGGPNLYRNYDTDWCYWATVITNALNNGCVTFTGWNLLLDEKGRPNIGPFECGGLATLDSKTKELTYSGQYRAFEHFSRFIKKGAKIYPTELEFCDLRRKIKKNAECCAVKNKDGSHVLIITNDNEEKMQLQYFYKNEWYYIEALANSITTIVFDN